MERSKVIRLARVALWAQSVYYVLTGALPLLNMTLFQFITGPKIDLWLVRMVGLLAVSIGLSLGLAARRRVFTPEIVTLSLASALSFAGIDIVYVSAGRIRPIYLGDALVEIILVAVIAGAALRSSPKR